MDTSGGAGAGFMMALLITIFGIFGFFFNRCANQFARRCTRVAGLRARAEPLGGWGRLGLADAAIASLPLTKLAAAAECAVCLGDVAAGEVARLLPLCGHTFHMECVDTWLRSRATCPLCRQTVIDVNETPRNVQDAQPAQAQGPILLPQADGRAPLAQARNQGGEGQQCHSLQVLD